MDYNTKCLKNILIEHTNDDVIYILQINYKTTCPWTGDLENKFCIIKHRLVNNNEYNWEFNGKKYKVTKIMLDKYDGDCIFNNNYFFYISTLFFEEILSKLLYSDVINLNNKLTKLLKFVYGVI